MVRVGRDGRRLFVQSADILNVRALSQRVVQVHGAVFNVRDYGAVGDDKTDNTTAFSGGSR